MKTSLLLPVLASFSLLSGARATLVQWQGEVNSGAAPATTLFSTVSGAAPILFNVGALNGDRSFEFIVNASGVSGDASVSSALLGTQVIADGRQGLKFEQWNNTGMYGLTAFTVADHTSTVNTISNTDSHLVFTSNGTDTILYVNGAAVYTFTGVALALTGQQGLGAAVTPEGAFFDNMIGNILGFASYDTALTPAEVTRHYNAFTAPVPEPAVSLLAGVTAAGALTLRRKTRRA